MTQGATDLAARVWYLRDSCPGTAVLTAYLDERYPRSSVVDRSALQGAPPADGSRLSSAHFRPGTLEVTRIDVSDRYTPGAPPLWYVEVPEFADDPKAMNLVAFSSDLVPEGVVVAQAAFPDTGATVADQVGALRWWPEYGQIHQIYVSPDWRRRRIATKLLYAANIYRKAKGWPPLSATGERTDLGEALAAAAPVFWQPDIAPRSRVMPPMTPGEAPG